MFHDRFPDFVDEIREHLQSPLVRTPWLHVCGLPSITPTPQDGETESFAEHVQKLVEEEPTVSWSHSKMI